MKILKAEHLGMCFGVRDAINLALQQAEQQPLTILGELVHNRTVLHELEQHGIQFASSPGQVATKAVMITAHGAAQKTVGGLQKQGLTVLEATCPLVHFAHQSLRHLVKAGCHPVIIGKRDHVEVRGMTGDLEAFDVVLSEDEVDSLQERPRFGVVAQTTQPLVEARKLVARLQQRFPQSEVRFVDTVCQPTKQRQNSAIELAQQCDLVIVIGGANSNNTRQLAATCANHCRSVFHVQSARDLKLEWFTGADTVGITAGTSTPASLIEEVEHWIREHLPEPELCPAR
jgi:4-hydroxy-3-methylbut-2-en-1-yl diphosphate reductase